MYKQETLKNGLKIVTSNMPQMESISIGVWIGVGARYEEKRYCGISHLIEHMLFKGTLTRTTSALKEAIEGVGGSFNAFTGEDVTCYLVKIPASYMELGLDVLTDMVLNPALDPAELEKEKYVICEEIKMYLDQPAQHVFDMLAEAMWPRHPLGRPIAGFIDTVKSFRREDLVDFRNTYYQPANITVVSSGKINRKKNIEFTKKVFSTRKSLKKFPLKPVTESDKSSGIKVLEKATEQTHLALGFHSLKRNDRSQYALKVLNTILGGNMSSRLFDRLREKKALCYDISSSAKSYKDTGAFIIHSGVDNSKLFEATGEIVREINEIKKNPVTSEELFRAKEYMRGQMLLALEDTASRMLWLGNKITCGGKAPSVKEVFQGIEKVTAKGIMRLANAIFDKKNINFATIGPAKEDIIKKIESIFKFKR